MPNATTPQPATERELILLKALKAIAAISTPDCAEYVAQADSLAVDALVEYECHERKDEI